MDNETTFDSSTNELQLLEFLVGEEFFGINIAKVSEIIRFTELTPVPSSPDAIEGVFMHRDKLVTVIDLHVVLGMSLKEDEHGEGLLIVCDFEQFSVAFHVCAVLGIKRLTWSSIEKPPSVSKSSDDSITTGMAKLDDKIIMILDFEKIICDLNLIEDYEQDNFENIDVPEELDLSKRLVIAEDSPFLCKVLMDALRNVGFKNVNSFYNGLEAWEYIKSKKGSPNLKNEVAAVISDIEMPQMDGHSLTRLIKEDKELANIPVFMFSSLIHENMRGRGDSAGADGQFARSQIGELITALTEHLTK
ncbi:MAG: chemotaxis protein [Oscillospiraceae bacterium]|jgi:two-component system chemotaxis response regulator CheV|nr:chemotaxis protein [Oscillospiraceae bacterium]